MANTETTAPAAEAPKVDPNAGKKRVNFMVDAEVYDKTFGGERWDKRMSNPEYLEFVLTERIKNSAK